MSRWPSDLFASAASYYARYRRYPDALYETLVARCGLDGTGRLLDLGCGTGQLTIGLAPHVSEAIGVDPDPDMLAEARRSAGERGVTNVRFVHAHAEDLPLGLGSFCAVTIGTALHWMDRERVLNAAYDMLVPGGVLAVCGAGEKHSTYTGPDPRPVYGEVIRRFLGPERRAGAATFTHPIEPHEAVIARSPFGSQEILSVPDESTQTIDDIVGLLFSTSFANRRLLGEDAGAFEQQIRTALTDLQPSGAFRVHTDYEIILARKH